MFYDISKPKNHLNEILPSHFHCISGGGSKDNNGFPPPPSPPPPIFKGDGTINLTPINVRINPTDEFAKIDAKFNINDNFYIAGTATTDYNRFGNKAIIFGISGEF